MKVGELNAVIMGKMIVYKFRADGYGFEVLWDKDGWAPPEIAERKIFSVFAAEKNVFHVYVKSEG